MRVEGDNVINKYYIAFQFLAINAHGTGSGFSSGYVDV